MKKQKVHFSIYHCCVAFPACGADICSGQSGRNLKVTDNRKKVTCKRCKATKRFRKVK